MEIKCLEKRDIIVLDCDDVLANSKYVFAEGISNQIGMPVDPNTWQNYSLTKIYPTLNWDRWIQQIIEEETLSSIPVNPLAKILIDSLKHHSKIIILTARGFHPDAKRVTEEWARTNNLEIDDVIVTDNTICKSDILKKFNSVLLYVDDNSDYFLKATQLPHIKNVFLMDQPWNRHISTDKRIKCLSEIILDV